MAFPDQEELKAAGVQAGVHLQLDGSGRCPRASDRAERSPHLEGSTCRPSSVLLALVEQQERVSPELEEPTSLRVRDSEERREGRVHDLGHLFRARLAEAGEPLGHRREAGDVDERDRSVDFAPDRRRLVSEPLEGQPWDERNELG